MGFTTQSERRTLARRSFLQFLLASPVLMATSCRLTQDGPMPSAPTFTPVIKNVFDLESAARARLAPEVFDFIASGADDSLTANANV